MKTDVTIKAKPSKGFDEALKRLKRSVLYVGIADDSDMNKRKDGTITNAQLGYIHETGSPSAGIPARPFLKPGVATAKPKIKKRMEQALTAALNNDAKSSEAALERCGIETASAVKKYLSTAEFEPLKDATIANRHRGRAGVEARGNEFRKSKHFGEGVRPLIDTGQLRNAIDSFVVKE